MTKGIILMALFYLLPIKGYAQVYGNERNLQMPTRDLYDQGVMNMYLRAVAETAGKRKASFNHYSSLALEAYNNHQWLQVINCVNMALRTDYENGRVYFLRGYANEQLGYLKDAKKDYKRGIKLGRYEAANALSSLKARRGKD